MSTQVRAAIVLVLGGALLCLGLWRHGTVAKGTAYRVMSGTNDIYAYRFEVREHLSVALAALHPVAARRARGQAYAAVSGVIACLETEPTRASVGPVESRVVNGAALPVMLTVMHITSVGWVESSYSEASMVRSDCRALQHFAPNALTVPTEPGS